MITPAYLRTMAAYSAAMNRKIYGAAALLSEAERHENSGAFWQSIHGTLSHILWADLTWMSRLGGWQKPDKTLTESDKLFAAFDDMHAARLRTDADLNLWAATIDETWLDQQQSWFSGAAQRDITASRKALIVHLFNHQTHHRGQVHALLTRSGQDPGDTDILLVLPQGSL